MPPRTVDPTALETALKQHVRGALCEEHGWDPRQCRLEIPLAGRRSIVRVVVGPGDERVVLRLFLRGPMIGEAKRLRRAVALLTELGLPTPRHLAVHEDFARRGAMLIEEEHIGGPTLDEGSLSDEVLTALAETLGRLHAVRSETWGDPLTPHRMGYAAKVIGRLSNRMRNLSLPGPHSPPRAERRELMRWAKQWTPVLGGVQGHSLKHSKLNPGNVILATDGRAVLLDVGDLSWGSPAKDLVQLHREAFGEADEAWAQFLALHRERVGPKVTEEIERLTPLFEVYYHVAEAAIAAKRLRRVAHGRSADRVHDAPVKIDGNWQAALDVAARCRPPVPADAPVD